MLPFPPLYYTHIVVNFFPYIFLRLWYYNTVFFFKQEGDIFHYLQTMTGASPWGNFRKKLTLENSLFKNKLGIQVPWSIILWFFWLWSTNGYTRAPIKRVNQQLVVYKIPSSATTTVACPVRKARFPQKSDPLFTHYA